MDVTTDGTVGAEAATGAGVPADADMDTDDEPRPGGRVMRAAPPPVTEPLAPSRSHVRPPPTTALKGPADASSAPVLRRELLPRDAAPPLELVVALPWPSLPLSLCSVASPLSESASRRSFGSHTGCSYGAAAGEAEAAAAAAAGDEDDDRGVVDAAPSDADGGASGLPSSDGSSPLARGVVAASQVVAALSTGGASSSPAFDGGGTSPPAGSLPKPGDSARCAAAGFGSWDTVSHVHARRCTRRKLLYAMSSVRSVEEWNS